MKNKTLSVSLTESEYTALAQECAWLRIKPEELAWCGIDALMQSMGQASEEHGFLRDIIKRFDCGHLPEWALQPGKEGA